MRWSSLFRKLEVAHDPELSTKELFLQNDDLKPVEKDRRRYTHLSMIALWIADAVNVNTFMISSAPIQTGLNFYQAWLAVIIGYTISAGFVVLSGHIGAVYHISFPVVCRASFGIFGSYWPIINRVVMACIWFGVQSWLGGNCVKLMISSIWLNASKNVPNHLESAGTTSYDFLCFFLFIFIMCVCIWFPVHSLRHLFTVKAYVAPAAAVALLIWTVKRAGGIGPVVRQDAKIEGSELAWEFIKATMTCIANFAALIMNDPDFTRFAKKPQVAMWPQMITIPLSFAITSLIGILVASSSTVMYDSPIWSPLDVLNKYLDEDPSAGARAGIFLIGAALALAQVGCNLIANSVSAGTDMTALLPRFLSVRRGGYICAAVGFAMCPWKLLSGSSEFTTYLDSYTVFLSSIAGVMISDYYIVRKGKLIVPDLYSMTSGSTYMYRYGISWRAYLCYILGIAINVTGFAGSVGAKVPIGGTYIYNLNYFAGFIVSLLTYWLVCHFFPVPGCNEKFSEEDAVMYDMEELEGEERAASLDNYKLDDGDDDVKKLTPINSNNNNYNYDNNYGEDREKNNNAS